MIARGVRVSVSGAAAAVRMAVAATSVRVPMSTAVFEHEQANYVDN